MQSLLINALDCLAILVFLYLLVDFRDRRRRGGLSYPPGPPRWPIIGSLLHLPKDTPWSEYANMSKKYGDIIYFRAFSKNIVVLSSLSAVKDLFERRGQIYSARYPLPVAEMMEIDWPIFMGGMNDTWRKGRKILYGSLRSGAMVSYWQVMQERTNEFLAQLRANPKDFRAHAGLLQGKLIMSLAFGYDMKEGDKILEAPIQLSKLLVPHFRPGWALINHFPFLRHIPSWVPYLSYEPSVQEGRKLTERVRNEPLDFVKNALHTGTAVNSMASEHLQKLGNLVGSERQKQEEVIGVAMGSVYQAGADTTVSSMMFLFMALVLFPQVQKRAQAELDVVIGRDRLPTFNDRPHLPYIEALCKELMRWQMVTPMSIVRVSIEDDVYKGDFIPKGSRMMVNTWAILRDPEIYPEPDEFKPERFLNEDGSVRDDLTISLAFGNGKRICPGRHLVDATVYIVASSVLSVFNITKAKDENGDEIPVKFAITTKEGLAIRPEKFECSFIPRDKVAEDLISANALF